MAPARSIRAAPGRIRLRLYVAGDAPNSQAARRNLAALVEATKADWDIEIVDVLLEPSRAGEDGVVFTPTLVRLSPPPVRQVVGSLSSREAVLSAIGPAGVVA